jgi:hypothetical protein
MLGALAAGLGAGTWLVLLDIFGEACVDAGCPEAAQWG